MESKIQETFAKIFTQVKKKINPWKNRVACIILFLISILLLTQTLYCFLNAPNYPFSASELIRSRYDTNLPAKVNVYSVPIFLPCPVTSKSTYEITITSLQEVQMKCTMIFYLTGNCTFNFQQATLLSIDEINNLIVTLNGKLVTPFLSIVDGSHYYTINGFNLTDTNQIETLIFSFDMKRNSTNFEYIKIPWVFNENYAQYIHFPSYNVPVGENQTSGINTLKIDFQLPFRQIVANTSGWIDRFDEPLANWIHVDSSHVTVPYLQYPINQTIETDGNVHYFKTNFSEQNIANGSCVTFIPDLGVILFFLYFITSPFYIFVIEYYSHKSGKKKHIDSDITDKSKGFFYLVFVSIGKYYFPIIGYIAYLVSFGQLFPLLSYLTNIANIFLCPIVFGYPVIFYIVLHRTILRT